MSDHPQSLAFPQRTPVFTAGVVIAAILLFGWLINRYYHAAPPVDPRGRANPADFAEDQRWKMTPEGRAKALADLHAREQAQINSYGWIDQQAGIVRLPIDRAIQLTVRDHARK